MKHYISILAITLSIISCTKRVEKQTKTVAPSISAKRTFIKPIQDNLDAHGGLVLWNSFQTLRFQRPIENGAIQHIVDLKSRNEIISNDTTYTVGYNGDQTWVLPDSSAFLNARFYKNLHFYFFALPFMSADEGVFHESLGQKVFNGTNYDVVKITYGENVGDSPEDQYILYINSETKVLDMINYSVTYFDSSRGDKYSAIIYHEYQTINGLKVPKSFSGYKWENDSIGDQRYQATFENVIFETNAPDQSTFAIPENAYVE